MKPYEFLVTNESIEAIMEGLDISRGDSVLTVCGSGDCAFAVLEKVEKIIVIDRKPSQIQYFSKRRELLEGGHFKEFLNPGEKPRDNQDSEDLRFRNRYFSPRRLGRIKRKLEDKMIVERVGDIFDLNFSEEGIKKVYLSNTLTYGSFAWGYNYQRVQQRIQKIMDTLPEGGLIYISDGEHVVLDAERYHRGTVLDSNLEINKRLTETAQRLQGRMKHWSWQPFVFQKTAS